MSYQVLARKYRPRVFSELVGQEHVSRALVHALDQDRLHHAYLFTGTRGVGKTTIARILARALNCEQGVSSQPCGACDSCREISEGRFVDLIEVDAASRTKVEDTRELLENVQYAPTRGRYKVYLIDEVHMLSAHSFNALLKTLEEPPPHVKFLLATTDPKKLPVTVLSRCLQFSLKALSGEKIAGHLEQLLEREMISSEPQALLALARAARGSLRDALSLTDQAIAFSGEKLSTDAVRTMLGNVDRDHVAQLLQALAGGDAGAVLQALDEVSEHSPDELALLDELISSLHRLAVAQAIPARETDETLCRLAETFQAEQVQLYYDIAVRGRRDLQDAPEPRAGLEMILLRMVLFRPEGVLRAGEGPAKKPPESAVSQQGSSARATVEASRPAADVQSASREAQESGADARIEDLAGGNGTSPSPAAAVEPESAGDPEPEPAAEPEPRPGPEPDDNDPASWWAALTGRLPLEGVVRSLARSCVLVERDGDRWQMALDPGHQVLAAPERVRALEKGLSDYLQRSVRLDIRTDDNVGDTPDVLERRRQEARRDEVVRLLRGDPVVRELVSRFDARLDEASIEPEPRDSAR